MRQKLAASLIALGHEAVVARPLGMGYATDDEHLLVAAHHNRAVVTYNRKDLVLLHHAWLRWQARWQTANAHVGVVILPDNMPTPDAAQIIDDLLRQQPSNALRDALYEWRGTAWFQEPLKTTHPLPEGETTDG